MEDNLALLESAKGKIVIDETLNFNDIQDEVSWINNEREKEK